MPSVYDTLCQWARKTTTSFGELHFVSWGPDDMEDEFGGMIYRLKHWPDLPCHTKTAGVLRTLSMMSTRPVNRHWILANTKLRANDVDRLLEQLVAQGAVEAIDGSKFPAANW